MFARPEDPNSLCKFWTGKSRFKTLQVFPIVVVQAGGIRCQPMSRTDTWFRRMLW